MCQDVGTPTEARLSAPRPIRGAAVDPIALEPVDEVTITVLVDNVYDGLLTNAGPARRTPLPRSPSIPAAVFEGGRVAAGLVAEHGFSALVRVRVGERTHTLLFDTGISPHGMADNLERLGIDVGEIVVVVLSHGHFDHAGGLEGLARLRRGSGLPITVHPEVWTQRRILLPGNNEWPLPSVSRAALEKEGFGVIERRTPSLLLDGAVLITGEVDRTTEFEHGMKNHEAFRDGRWAPDPLIIDDQALVVHVRGRGLVVLTGCGHAGAINIARHACRLTSVDRLDALLGGFHLSGPAFEPVIEPTVAALTELAPSLLVPAHCTGFRAQHRLATALPDAFLPNSVGTSYTLAAA
jgi:7,8-dihydropterin-6-yl-methyl-4-(beta-D-ribofuranosyl)aminobenzene 5'-phosphate synthase